ncbi:MAG: carboxy terminal-processing peptidase [Ferruginibacter sp.]
MKRIFLPLLIFTSLYVHAQQPATSSLRSKVITLHRFLEQNHYLPVKWNDTSSAMLYTKWIEKLDDEKVLFTQNEIAILETYKTKLDDEILGRAPITIGGEFYNRSTAMYQICLKRTDSILKALLAKPLDFSKPDNISWPFTVYAGSVAELGQRWQRFLKWRVLENIADELSDKGKTIAETLPADFVQLEKDAREKAKKQEGNFIYELLKTPQQFKSDMEEDYLNAIAWCYDPHTTYMSIKEKKEFDTEMSASEYSAGFELEENDKGDLAISFLQPGGSAWRSGQLHTGDQLIKIESGGIEKDISAITDEDELGSMLSGNNQADLEITVKTAAGELKTIKLHKEKIDDEEGIVKSYVLRGNKNIGYINLPGFYSREDESITDEKDITYDGSANDVSKEIVKLRKDTIAGLILDLRYNGGGSMWEAMQLSGIFIDIGPVASVKEKDGKVRFLKDPNRGTIYDGPLMILINGASASASEFVSAVFQDYNRAIIVGGTTYGKGTAQVVLPMDTLPFSNNKTYEDFVKVTQRKFYRVNGNTAQWTGVVPDIELPDIYSDESYKEKANSSALQPDNSKKGIYEPGVALPVQALKTKSEQRVSGNAYFKTINNFNAWMKDYKKGRTIPLQWNSYAIHYKKTMEMFKELSDDDHVDMATFSVSNNGFDRQRINVSTQHSKENNEAYLKMVKKDITLAEAYKIMMDWINK